MAVNALVDDNPLMYIRGEYCNATRDCDGAAGTVAMTAHPALRDKNRAHVERCPRGFVHF